MPQSHTRFRGLPVGGDGEWGAGGKQIRRENGEGGPSKTKTSKDKNERKALRHKSKSAIKMSGIKALMLNTDGRRPLQDTTFHVSFVNVCLLKN